MVPGWSRVRNVWAPIHHGAARAGSTEKGEVTMSFNRLFDVLGAIVVVAGITAVVSHPASAAIIRAMGQAFSGVFVGGIKAALSR